MTKIMIAAGGSGGHIFPAVALARRLCAADRPSCEILFVGGDKALDRRIFEKEGLRASLLSSNKLPHRLSFGVFRFLFWFVHDAVKALILVARFKPDVTVGFGGYVSFPPILASYLFGIPRIAHEQNVAPGRANSLLFNFVDKIAISFEETRSFVGSKKEMVMTGNPIRSARSVCDKTAGIRRFGLDERKFTILVIGGSQGAHTLNESFIEAVRGLDEKLKSSLQIIHITGVKDYAWAVGRYKALSMEHRVYSFIDSIEEAYCASDLVITRSGASALFEISYFGKPMIVIPYPFALKHQAENAKVFAERGAAVKIDESSLGRGVFKDAIVSLMTDRARLEAIARSAKSLSVPDAADRLADEVLNLAGR